MEQIREKIGSLLTTIVIIVALIIALAILINPEFAVAWAQLMILILFIGLLDSLSKKK